MIPQCNPKAGYLAHKTEIDAAIARVLNSGWYILGKEVETFEREFAIWLGVAHVVGVANGTDAIELALRAAGIREGDKVATVSHTAVATVAAIRRCGALPVFVDIDPDYYTMSPPSLEAALDRVPDIKAVVVVHLYGQMADMPAILESAKRHDLIVIEDCAQAHGAALDGRKAGTRGDFGCFSFYPTKNLGALGDGGAVVTDNAAAAENLCALRQYGWDKARVSQIEGINSRLDELQAAVLWERLKYLGADNAARRRIAAAYRSGLQECSGIGLPSEREGCEHVYHQFVIRCKNREVVVEALAQSRIGYAIHYPQPVHRQAAYADARFTPVSLRHTEDVVTGILSLPMYPELSLPDVDRVVAAIRKHVD